MTKVRIVSGQPNDIPPLKPAVNETFGEKAKKAIFSSTAKEVGMWLLEEKIIPFLKDTTVAIVEVAMYGSTSSRVTNRRQNRSLERENVSYRTYYQYGDSGGSRTRAYYESERRPIDRIGYNTKIDYHSLIVEIKDPMDKRSRDDAEQQAIDIVRYIRSRINTYQKAEKADLFDIFNEVTGSNIPINRQDRAVGWVNENDIGYCNAYDEGGILIGYLIDVKDVVDLKRM